MATREQIFGIFWYFALRPKYFRRLQKAPTPNHSFEKKILACACFARFLHYFLEYIVVKFTSNLAASKWPLRHAITRAILSVEPSRILRQTSRKSGFWFWITEIEYTDVRLSTYLEKNSKAANFSISGGVIDYSSIFVSSHIYRIYIRFNLWNFLHSRMWNPKKILLRRSQWQIIV